MNPYEILEVSPQASSQEIKNSYRSLAKKYHPDRNGSAEAAVRIKLINEAYAMLSDPQQRARYDNFGRQPVAEIITEDPRAAYKREFLRKKREEKIREEMEAQKMRERFYGWAWKGCVALAIFASVLIADYYLPRISRSEKVQSGYQKHLSGRAGSGGVIVSYMVTENFHLRVPDDIHIYYDYYSANEPVLINMTPVFRLPVELGLFHRGEFGYFPVKGNIHYNWQLKYLLLLSCLVILSSKEYSLFRYRVAFFPFVLFAIILFMLD